MHQAIQPGRSPGTFAKDRLGEPLDEDPPPTVGHAADEPPGGNVKKNAPAGTWQVRRVSQIPAMDAA